MLSGGNVGIGMSNPTTTLEVNGYIKAHDDIAATADSGGQAYQAFGRSSDSYTWAPIAYTNNGSAFTGGMAYSPSGAVLAVGSGLTNVFTAYSNGDMYFPICNCYMSSFSDERMKTGIKDLPRGDGLDAIMKLRPVTFHWKDKSRNAKEGEQVGFVAQEVEKIFPDVVREGDMKTFIETDKGKEDIDHPKNLFAASLTAPIVKAIQELKSLFDTDHDTLAKLKTDNDNLRARLEITNKELRAELYAQSQEIEKLKSSHH